MARTLTFCAVLAALFTGAVAGADEIDDILKAEAKNRGRLKSFHFEGTSEAVDRRDRHQDYTFSGRVQRVGKNRGADSTWLLRLETRGKENVKVDIKFLAPDPMKVKVLEGKSWRRGKDGKWAEQEFKAEDWRVFLALWKSVEGYPPDRKRGLYRVTIAKRTKDYRTLKYVGKKRSVYPKRLRTDVDREGMPISIRISSEVFPASATVQYQKVKGVQVAKTVEFKMAVPQGDASKGTITITKAKVD